MSWFLSSIAFCYLIFPLAYKHVTRGWFTAVIAIYTVLALLIPYDKVNAILYVNPLVRFTDFYIGMVLCRIYEHKKMQHAGKWELLLLVSLLGVLSIYTFCDAKLRNAPLFWSIIALLILIYAQEQGRISRLLQTKPMLFLSSLTMPLFMTHQMVLNILLRRLPELPSLLMLTVCILTVLIISWGIQIIFSRLFRL